MTWSFHKWYWLNILARPHKKTKYSNTNLYTFVLFQCWFSRFHGLTAQYSQKRSHVCEYVFLFHFSITFDRCMEFRGPINFLPLIVQSATTYWYIGRHKFVDILPLSNVVRSNRIHRIRHKSNWFPYRSIRHLRYFIIHL